jgi:hypothetical protein
LRQVGQRRLRTFFATEIFYRNPAKDLLIY